MEALLAGLDEKHPLAQELFNIRDAAAHYQV